MRPSLAMAALWQGGLFLSHKEAAMGNYVFKTETVKRLQNGNLVKVTRFFDRKGQQVEWRVRLLHRAGGKTARRAV